MGLLTYDIPTLNTTGAQPATDIVDALTDIQTETNGNIETANLVDGGLGYGVWPGDKIYVVESPARISLTDAYRELIYLAPIPECSVFSVYWSCDVGNADGGGVKFRQRTAFDESSPNPIFPTSASVVSLPGGLAVDTPGSPLIFEWSAFTLFALDARLGDFGFGVSYVENVKLYVRTYGGF